MKLFREKNNFKKANKVIIPISQGVAMFIDTCAEKSQKLFSQIQKITSNYGYEIDTNTNKLHCVFALLSIQILYAFQVYSSEEANLICDWTEHYLETYSADKSYVFGKEDELNVLDISKCNILSLYKFYVQEYISAEKEYLTQKNKDNFIGLPANKVIFTCLGIILNYDFKSKGYNELMQIFNKILPLIYENIGLWKTLSEHVEYNCYS